MTSKCPPSAHNRFSADYDGRLEIVKEIPGWRHERCSVCGAEFYQRLYSLPLQRLDGASTSTHCSVTEESWWCRSRRVRLR
jgi:hypothetical protein